MQKRKKPLDSKTVCEEFSKLVRERRKELGYTQAEVASLLRMSSGNYCCFETKCTDVALSRVVNICRVLDLRLEEFIKGLDYLDRQVTMDEIFYAESDSGHLRRAIAAANEEE